VYLAFSLYKIVGRIEVDIGWIVSSDAFGRSMMRETFRSPSSF